ncbi:hypothetical protein RQP46_008102 [Phenoliferia psychrophenolica]
MAASITDQLLRLQLAPVAPPSHSESNPSGEAKTTTPNLPPELISDIIDLTTEIMAYKFLDEVKSRELNGTLDRLRFGAGPAGLDRRPWAPGEISDDRVLQALVNSLPCLRVLEYVGIGLRFSGNAKLGFKQPIEIVISNASTTSISMYLRKLDTSPRPTRLFIIETRSCDGDDRNWAMEPLGFNYLAEVPHISITTNQPKRSPVETYLALLVHLGTAHAAAGEIPRLRSFRLESSQTRSWIDDEQYYLENPAIESSFPFLIDISTHLTPLHLFATIGKQPALTSLEVLPDGDHEECSASVEEAKIKLLDIIKSLPLLRTLKVPVCWRSEAVEVACKKKGVALKWT